ncbi:unnamed protein product [Mytilus edulis]|uniref:Ankyrin repeat protein n=1 Tax=Mytilus edulis TaxID=6550 RepID=A0A8S3RPM8_MYTED|nr:unnamed protein product [Mytilus edulis]
MRDSLNLQTDVRNTVYKTINDTCDSFVEILQWLNENTKVIDHPVTSLLEYSCKNNLQKIVKWILQTFDHNTLNMDKMIIEAYKARYHEIVAWSIINDDQNAINKSEVFDLAVYNEHTDVIHYLLENIDHKLLDISKAMDIACRRGNLDIVEMLLLNVDYKEINVKEAIDNVFSGITFDTVKPCQIMKNRLENYIDKASECERIKIVKLMLETFDHKLFDMTTIMNTAYEQRWFDLIKWMIEVVDDSLLDINEMLRMACQSECLDIVTLLAEKTQELTKELL